MNKRKIVLVALFITLFLLASGLANGADVTVDPRIPGNYAPPAGTAANPAGSVANLYQFALMISGLLAFVVIVYASIRYAAAAGNPSQQSDAKDRIYQALIGLALLVGAAIILSTINPKFILGKGIFSIPGIETLSPSEGPALITVSPFGGGSPPECQRAGVRDGDACNDGTCIGGLGGTCLRGICTNCK